MRNENIGLLGRACRQAGGWVDRGLGVGILVVSCLLLVVSLTMGCGQQAPEVTPTPTVGAVTISGKLYSGSVRTSAAQALSSGIRVMGEPEDPLQDYTVVAVGTVTNKVYFPTSKTATADGAFSISVPSGESFYLEIIDNNKKFVAPISFGASGESVFMAITPEAGGGAIDLGKVVYESAKGAAVPTLEVSASKLDEDSSAKKKSSEDFVPVGAGNLGRGTGEAYYSGTLKDKIDEDDDGLPDVVDIDDDGDGKVDGLDDVPRLSNRVEVQITGAEHANAFSNLPENYQSYPTYRNSALNTTPIHAGIDTILAIEVSMTSGISPSTFSDIRVIEGPAWLGTAIVGGNTSSAYFGYPTVDTSWESESHKLYRGSDRWSVWVKPIITPEAGDTLKFKVTKTDGTSQEFISTLSYVFKDIPRLVAYTDQNGTKEGAAALDLAVYQAEKRINNIPFTEMFTYEGTSLTLTWTAAKDNLGQEITNIIHNFDGINYYDDTGAVVGQTPSFNINLSDLTLGIHPDLGTTYSYTFTPTTDAFSYFKVDIKAVSPASGGGNAAQLVMFKKI